MEEKSLGETLAADVKLLFNPSREVGQGLEEWRLLRCFLQSMSVSPQVWGSGCDVL